jgi:hypothetical protein
MTTGLAHERVMSRVNAWNVVRRACQVESESEAYGLFEGVCTVSYNGTGIIRAFAAEGVVDEFREGEGVSASDVARVLVGELDAIDIGDIEKCGYG